MQKTLYFGGPILTMEGPRPQYVTALLVEDGLIRALGTVEELTALAPDARQADLEGHALLPAFLDPHSHFSACANALLQCSVAEARDFEGLVEIIRSYIAEQSIPEGQWVMARDLDPAMLAEHRVPDRQVLDRAAPRHPLVLQHRSGHVGVLDSLGLERMGIDGDTPDPDGGHIWKEDGQPTGYLEENAFLAVLPRLPAPDPARLMGAYHQAQRLYASHGIATAQEGMLSPLLVPLYQALCAQDMLALDVVAYPAPADATQIARDFPKHPRCRLGGYKIFLDGSPQSRTAWVRTPYEGGSDRGYPTLSDAQVDEAVALALDTGKQLLAHCNGDAAAEQYLQALERAAAAGRDVAAIRPVMIHAQLVGRDQLPRLKALGVIPSFFVAHVYHWGDTHLENLGPQRAAAISPAHSAGELGLPYTFHQDSPVIPPDMQETLWCAAVRTTRAGVVLGPEERVSTYDALRAVTANAAHQYFEEGSKGTLAPGKRADLTILDRDPLSIPPEELRHLQVLATIKDGKTIYTKA